MIKKLVFACIFLTAALVSHALGDLTGHWSCNDGGTYYLRQTGSQVRWYGEAADTQPAWANVFSGRIHGARIKGNWTDVPKGGTTGSGDLELVIEKGGNSLRAVNKTGGFTGSRWARMVTGTSASRQLKPLKPSGSGSCVSFNPSAVSLRDINGRWKIVADDHWLFDFGSDQAAGHKALKVIRHYRMDRSCVIGRPKPSFSYLLAKGGIPSGAMAGEDCVAFDPGTVSVSKIQGSWKIVSGRHWLFDFGRSEAEARQALAVIRRHGFSRSCRVGRPDSGFTYLRR